MDDIGGVWRTIGGRRVFIKDGEDLLTAMKNSGKFGNKKPDKKEENVESNIRKEINDFFNKQDPKNEHLLMFNDKGEKLQEIVGKQPDNVGNLSTILKIITGKKNSILTAHNHPNNTSFSYKDIKTFNRFKSLDVVVVVTKDKIYTLSKNNARKIKTRQLTKQYQSIKEKLNTKNGKSNNNIHLACEEISKQLGWRYEIYERN